MCDCFYLGAPHGHALRAPSPRDSGDAKLFLGTSRSGTWVDVHAHPGRCFLRGLAPTDPLGLALGGESVEGALADIREGGLAAVAFSTVADLRVLSVDPAGGLRAGREFEPGEAYRDHRRQLDALRSLADLPSTDLVLEAMVPEVGRFGVLISCEGADFLEGRIERVEEASQLGVRAITLVHYRVNELGDIQTDEARHGGLTAFGADVVSEMNRLGMVIDLAHATYAMTRQVLEASQKPVMISHSHLARSADSHPRLLSHEHALAVANAGGLVGAWPAGVELETFEDYLDEILRLIDLLGTDHVAIGTDMDANYRPVLDRYQQFPDLATRLEERGVSIDEVDAIMGLNFWRLFRETRESSQGSS